ncbi:MAG: FAD:protein FMN transferase [Solobacterium sp.]|nr:FAD:protein FMN transferase [Solobacterium sp.]MBQ6356836.1 FAD:protein FMN transferase [Solobacterium sp.]MBR0213860.1 FAD:protein FMN transferase [Solobacterium sp.]
MKKTCKAKLILALSLLAGCAPGPSPGNDKLPGRYSAVTTEAGFDTVVTMQEWVSSEEEFTRHFSLVQEKLRHYNDLFDIYNNYEGLNNLRTINENAGIAPVETSPEVIEMLLQAREFHELSDGRFDVTMGALLQVWHNYRDRGIELNLGGTKAPVPDISELQAAAAHSGWDSVIIDEENSTVFITDPEMSLDVGGIAKGFAVERAAQMLAELQPASAVINAGGNNRTLASKPDGSPWVVRIQNPDGGERMLLVELPGAFSFVTSGDYERYYIGEDGKRYHHIIDPETLYPADRYRSVTVITEDSGAADCLSTALFVMSLPDGRQLLERYCQAHPGTFCEAVWIMDAGQVPDQTEGKKTGSFFVAWTAGLDDKITFELN